MCTFAFDNDFFNLNRIMKLYRMNSRRPVFTAWLVGVLGLLCVGCGGGEDTPKPVAYLRIDMPEKDYHSFDTMGLPFSFEKAVDADVLWKKDTRTEKWIDLSYPQYRGVIYLTYKALESPDSLRAQIDTSYHFLSQHFNFSTGVDERQFVNPDNHVYATTCQLKGTNVACTYQFWATDSVRHFLRGALYLDYVPNNDSLAPVIDYLRADIDHLLETLTWK